MTYRQEYYEGEAEDRAKVVSVDERANVPYGSFDGVLQTEDTTPLEPDLVEHKYYAKDVGPVLALAVSKGEPGREELISFTQALTRYGLRMAADRSAHAHRARPPEGGGHRARARLLRRRARLRAAAADGRGSGVHLRGRLSPPHRPEHVAEPRRLAASARPHGSLPLRDPLSRPARRSPTRCAGSSRRAIPSAAPPTTASARRST